MRVCVCVSMNQWANSMQWLQQIIIIVFVVLGIPSLSFTLHLRLFRVCVEL